MSITYTIYIQRPHKTHKVNIISLLLLHLFYIVVECGDLIDPPNGVVSLFPGTIFGSEASYSCDTGYTLNGCPTRMCQASGNWSNSVPECISKQI